MTTQTLLENIKTTIILTVSFVLLFIFAYTKAFALPQIDSVVSGSVDFVNVDSTTLNITATDKAIVNYSSFNIAEGETVNITLPSTTAEFLNRVTGGSQTNILGNLFCNGIMLLVNEAGIYFGANSHIDVQGLIASTRDITNSDFLSGNHVFARLSKDQLDTLLVNKGTINIREGGFGVFIAGAVDNSGTIIAPLGTIAIAGAEMVTLNIAGGGLISIAINKEQAESVFNSHGAVVTKQVNNTGTISAPGGTVLLKAEAIPDIFEMAINLEGYVKADSYNGSNGLIKVETNGKVVGTLTASKAVEVTATNINITSNSSLTYIYKPDNMLLTSSILDNETNLITLQGEGINVTYSKLNDITLETSGTLNTTEGVIIQANSVKLIANKFGTSTLPVHIDANNTYIQRLSGNIDILESLGLGSTILLRGPPEDSFGQIIYNKDTNLTLEALNGSINISADVTVEANNLTLKAGQNITNSGTLKAANNLYLTAEGNVTSTGTLQSIETYESSYHFSVSGILIGKTYINDRDGAGNYGPLTIYDNLTDTGNINLTGNITLGADNLIITAGTSGSGSLWVNDYSIIGQGFNVTIMTGINTDTYESSTIRTVNVASLTLQATPGAVWAQYIFPDNDIFFAGTLNIGGDALNIDTYVTCTNLTVNGTLNIGSSTSYGDLYVYGQLTVNGTLNVDYLGSHIGFDDVGPLTVNGTLNLGLNSYTYINSTTVIIDGEFNSGWADFFIINLTLTGTMNLGANTILYFWGWEEDPADVIINASSIITGEGTVEFGGSSPTITLNGEGAEKGIFAPKNVTFSTWGTNTIVIPAINYGGTGLFMVRGTGTGWDTSTFSIAPGYFSTAGDFKLYAEHTTDIPLAYTLILDNSSNSGSINIAGSWILEHNQLLPWYPAVINYIHGTETVTFNGNSAGKTIDPSAGSFYNLTITGGVNGYWTPQNELIVDNLLTVSSGTLDTSTFDLFSSHVLVNGGTLKGGGGAMNIWGEGIGTLTVSGGVFIAPATVDMTDSDCYIHNGGISDWLTNNSTFMLNNMGGSATIPADTYYNLILFGIMGPCYNFSSGTTTVNGNFHLYNGEGSVAVLGANTLTVLGNITIDYGFGLYVTTGTINIGGSWTNNNTFSAGTGTVVFNGAANNITQSINPGSGKFYSVTINNTGTGTAKVQLANNIQMDGTLTVTSGVLYLNGYNITDASGGATAVRGNIEGTIRLNGNETVFWTTNDTDSGTYEYVGTAGPYTIKDFGDVDYYNLIINGASTTFNVGNALVVAGALTVQAGTFGANGQAVTVAGLTTIKDDTTYLASTNTQTFNGGLRLEYDSSFTGSTGTVYINGDLTFNTAYHDDLIFTAPSLLYISGNIISLGAQEEYFNPGSGTVIFNGTGVQTINAHHLMNNVIISGNIVQFIDWGSLMINGTLTINEGTVLDINGFGFTLNTLVNYGTLRLKGNESITITNMDVLHGAVEYTGRNIAETLTIKDFGPGVDYYNLIINDQNTNKATFRITATLTLNNDLTLSSGIFNMNDQSLYLKGDLSLANGTTWTKGSGITTFNGGTLQTITDNNTTKQDLGDLNTGANNTTVRFLTNAKVESISSVSGSQSGIVWDWATNNVTVTITGGNSIGAPFSLFPGAVFTGTAGTVIITAPGEFFAGSEQAVFYDLNYQGTGVWNAVGAIVVNNDLTIQNSTLNMTSIAGNHDLTVGGDLLIDNSTLNASHADCSVTVGGSWDNNGTFTAGSGTVTFTGGSGSTTITSGASPFHNLVFNDADTTWALQDALTAAGTFNLQNGTFNSNTKTITVTGLTTISGGTYQSSTAKQTFNAGLTVTGGTVIASGELEVNGTLTINGGNLDASSGELDINGGLNIISGTLTAPSGSLYITGNWTNNGTFNPGTTGCVVFDGAADQTISGASDHTFSQITIIKAGGSVILGANVVLSTSSGFGINFYSITPINLQTYTFTISSCSNIFYASVGGDLFTATTGKLIILDSGDMVYEAEESSNISLSNVQIGDATHSPTVRFGLGGAPGNVPNWYFKDLNIVGSSVLQAYASYWKNVYVSGNFTSTGTLNGYITNLYFNGTSAQNITGGGYDINHMLAPVYITNTSAVVSVLGHMRTSELYINANVNLSLADNIQIWVDNASEGYLGIAGTVTYGAGSAIIEKATSDKVYNFYGSTVNKSALITDFDSTYNVNIKRGTINQNQSADCLFLTIDAGTAYTVVSGVLTIGNSLINNGTFNASGTINIAGNWTNNGTFNAGSGTVNFTGGSGSKTITSNAPQSFNILVFNDSDTTWTLQDNLSATNITVTLGTLNVGAGKTITATGTLTVNGGTITGTANNVTIIANAINHTSGSITTTTSGNITIGAANDIILATVNAAGGAGNISVTSTSGHIYGNNLSTITASTLTLSAGSGKDIGKSGGQNLLVNAVVISDITGNHPNICITNNGSGNLTIGAMTTSATTSIDFNRVLTVGQIQVTSGSITIGNVYAPSALYINGALSTTNANITIKATILTSNASGTITTNTSGDVIIDGSGDFTFAADVRSAGSIIIGNTMAPSSIMRVSPAQIRLTNTAGGYISLTSTGAIGTGAVPILTILASSANNYVTANSTVAGNIYIDGTGSLRFNNVTANNGAIIIGKNNAPVSITRNAGTQFILNTDDPNNYVSLRATGAIGTTVTPLFISLAGVSGSYVTANSITNGSIFIDSTGDLAFAHMTAAAGGITIGKFDFPSNIYQIPEYKFTIGADASGCTLTLNATGSIGTAIVPIRITLTGTSYNYVKASSTVSGDIYLDSLGDLKFNTLTAANGSINVGTLLQPAAVITSAAISASGITINVAGHFYVDSNIISTNGDLILIANYNNILGGNFTHNSGVISTVGSGDITIRAGSDENSGTPGSSVALKTITSVGNITISAGNGSITGYHSNLTGNVIYLYAKNGIGTFASPVNLIASRVDADCIRNSGTGNIYLSNSAGNLNIGTITADVAAGEVYLFPGEDSSVITNSSSITAALVYIASNFVNNGISTFSATFIFNGTALQAITSNGVHFGAITITNSSIQGVRFVDALYCLSLTANSGVKLIEFAAGQTHTITGALTITGTSGAGRITLKSTVPGSAWTLNTTGATASVSHANIQDSSSTVEILPVLSHDLGNNTNWNLTSYLAITSSTGSIAAGSPLIITITAFDQIGEVALSYRGAKSLIFSGLGSITGYTPTVDGVALGSVTAITFANGTSTATLIAYKPETATLNTTDSTYTSTGHGLLLTVGTSTAHSLQWVLNPKATVDAGIIFPTFSLQVLDAYGNVYTTPITITLSSDIGSLSGTTVLMTNNGTAQFNNIAYNLAQIITLTASSGNCISATAKVTVSTIKTEEATQESNTTTPTTNTIANNLLTTLDNFNFSRNISIASGEDLVMMDDSENYLNGQKGKYRNKGAGNIIFNNSSLIKEDFDTEDIAATGPG